MAQIKIRKVEDKNDLKRFVKFPFRLYKDDPYWVAPIISEQIRFLDKNKGPFFEIGEAEYFLALKGNQVVGRISAHVNNQWNQHYHDRKGFFGFFETIKDAQVSNMLFSTAERWLSSKGRTSILGPMSFSVYDELTLLVDGFDSTPVLLQSYNPSYYIELIEKYRFKKAIDWYAYRRLASIPLKPVFFKVRDRVINRLGITIRNLDLRSFDRDAKAIKEIFNSAWEDNWGHLPLTDKQFNYLIDNLKALINPKLVFIAEKDGQPVGLSVSVPDANPALKKARGHLYPFGIIKILAGLKKITKLRTLILGVKKEYRGKGIDTVLLIDTIQGAINCGYDESECSLILENNIPIRKAMDSIDAKIYKTYRLYEKDIS